MLFADSMRRTEVRRTLQILVFGSLLSGFIYGFNVGKYSGVMLPVQAAYALSDAELGRLIAVFDFAEFVGVLLAPLADRFGRKRLLIVCAAILSLVPLLLLTDLPFWAVLVERAITGSVAGITFTIGLVFVAEVTQPRRRAALLSSLMIGLGAGYVAELGLSALFVESGGWRIVILLAAGPALLQLMGLVFMAESPVFFLLRRDAVSARLSTRYYGLSVPKTSTESDPGELGVFGLFKALRQPGLGRSILLGMTIVAAGTLSGAGLPGAYGPFLMQRFGVSDQALALEILMILMLVGLVIGLVALIPISRGKSAEVLVGSLMVLGASWLFLGISSGPWAVGFLGLLHLAFAFGIRTTVFQLLPGFLSDQTRVAGMAAFNLIYILLEGSVIGSFPLLLQTFGNSAYVLFAVSAVVIGIASRYALRQRGGS